MNYEKSYVNSYILFLYITNYISRVSNRSKFFILIAMLLIVWNTSYTSRRESKKIQAFTTENLRKSWKAPQKYYSQRQNHMPNNYCNLKKYMLDIFNFPNLNEKCQVNKSFNSTIFWLGPDKYYLSFGILLNSIRYAYSFSAQWNSLFSSPFFHDFFLGEYKKHRSFSNVEHFK